MKKKILFGLLILLIVIQFLPISTENPVITKEKQFQVMTEGDNQELTLIKNACYDCHSYSTNFPKYTRFQPLGWWIRGHIRGGRQKLNFSTWGDYSKKQQNHKLEECVEVLQENRMPLKSYTWLHPISKLTKEEKASLISYFTKLQSS